MVGDNDLLNRKNIIVTRSPYGEWSLKGQIRWISIAIANK